MRDFSVFFWFPAEAAVGCVAGLPSEGQAWRKDCLWNLGTEGIDEGSQGDAWELTLLRSPKRR